MMTVFEGVMGFVYRLVLWCVELVESFICLFVEERDG